LKKLYNKVDFNMSAVLIIFKSVCAIVGGILGGVVGELDSLFYALIIFVASDYIIGILLAIQKRKLSSSVGFKGISRKVLIFILVAVGNIIDKHIFESGSTLRTLIIMFYLSNEGISILENATEMGVPIPKKLREVIQKLGNDDDAKRIDRLKI